MQTDVFPISALCNSDTKLYRLLPDKLSEMANGSIIRFLAVLLERVIVYLAVPSVDSGGAVAH